MLFVSLCRRFGFFCDGAAFHLETLTLQYTYEKTKPDGFRRHRRASMATKDPPRLFIAIKSLHDRQQQQQQQQ